jgi:hypothetical protein
VAHAAYQTRTGQPPPLIIAGKFVEPGYDDIVLKEYAAAELLGSLTVTIEEPTGRPPRR